MPVQDPQDRLKFLEDVVIENCLVKLFNMIKNSEGGVFHNDCELTHIEEMVKLCHKTRSLLKGPEQGK